MTRHVDASCDSFRIDDDGLGKGIGVAAINQRRTDPFLQSGRLVKLQRRRQGVEAGTIGCDARDDQTRRRGCRRARAEWSSEHEGSFNHDRK